MNNKQDPAENTRIHKKNIYDFFSDFPTLRYASKVFLMQNEPLTIKHVENHYSSLSPSPFVPKAYEWCVLKLLRSKPAWHH